MRRQVNPIAVILMVVCALLAFIVAFAVKSHLPEAASSFKGLIFWGIVVVLGGGGALLCGKFMNRGDR